MVRINFLVNQVFDGWEPTDTRLGGTERGVVEWAEELAKRGHQVMVYHNSRTEDWDDFTYTTGKGNGTYNGVWYVPREAYFGDGDICINIKSPEVAPKEPTIFYTNDVDADKQDLSAYDSVIHISQWAADNIPVNNPKVFIVPHGYDEKLIYPARKIPKQCLYASSPDRGLDRLLEAWPTVMAAHPDATLLVTYGVDKGPDLPGVTYLGDVPEDMMAELYKTSDIWPYPCKGGELLCIAGIKAQAAGCVPVIVPEMALKETIKHGYFTTKEHFAETLSQVLDDNNRADLEQRRAEMVADHYPTIAESTDALLNVIETILKEKK